MLYASKIKQLFFVATIVPIVYVLFIKSHLFVSSSSLLIKNIDDSSTTPSILGVISGQSSSQTQDAYVVQEYLSSYEVFDKLDKKFNLKAHYESDSQDFYQRLYSYNSYEDYLELYIDRLELTYDEVSSILTISFLHTNSDIAKNIVVFLIKEAEDRLNIYNRSIANKHLQFIKDETLKQKRLQENSIKILEDYQNQHNFLDPLNQATSTIEIISSLKANLIEKQTNLRKIETYQTKESIEVINLKQEIKQIEKSIKELGVNLSGSSKSRLNKNIFEYSQLKAKVDLYNELYKQSLLQLQAAKVEANKSSKTMQILINPSKASSYTKPQKLREIITILLVMGILYGVASMLITIIKDHRE